MQFSCVFWLHWFSWCCCCLTKMNKNQTLANLTTESWGNILCYSAFFSKSTQSCFSPWLVKRFSETSCYVLLFNLLFADSIQMAFSQVLYILAACSLKITVWHCNFHWCSHPVILQIYFYCTVLLRFDKSSLFNSVKMYFNKSFFCPFPNYL